MPELPCSAAKETHTTSWLQKAAWRKTAGSQENRAEILIKKKKLLKDEVHFTSSHQPVKWCLSVYVESIQVFGNISVIRMSKACHLERKSAFFSTWLGSKAVPHMLPTENVLQQLPPAWLSVFSNEWGLHLCLGHQFDIAWVRDLNTQGNSRSLKRVSSNVFQAIQWQSTPCGLSCCIDSW